MSDPTSSPEPTGLGAMLRTARERAGMSIEDVARVTSVRSSYLEALETEDASELPEDVYARNFVRLYARAVQVDTDVALAAYAALHSTSSLAATPARPAQGAVQPGANPAASASATPMAGRVRRPAEQPPQRAGGLRRATRNVIPLIMTVAVAGSLVAVAVWGFNQLLDRSTSPVPSNSVTTGDATTNDVMTDDAASADLATDDVTNDDVTTNDLATDVTAGDNAPADDATNSDAASEATASEPVPSEGATDDSATADDSATGSDDTLDATTDQPSTDATETSSATAPSVPGNLPEDVLLTVTSDPPGAEVTVDAFALPGSTPISDAPVSARAERTVRVELEGFLPYEAIIDLTRDRDLLVTLEPIPGLATTETPEPEQNTVIVDVRERTWLEAYQSTERGVGERLVYTTAQPGERFEFTRPLYLHLGNAGGIDVTVDGEAIPPLGSSGAVLGRAFPESSAP